MMMILMILKRMMNLTHLAKKKRNKEIKALYLSGLSVAEICVRYDLSDIRYILQRQGISLIEERKKKLMYCKNHPDRESVVLDRCLECQRKVVRLRNPSVKSTTKYVKKKKVKQIFEARELTDGEKRIRDKYRRSNPTGGFIKPVDIGNVYPRYEY